MSKQVDERMTRARSALVMGHPFFGSLLMRLIVVERRDIATMATDGKHLFYNPAFLDTLSEKFIEGIQVHEALHCALRHTTRRGSRDPKLWNLACDYAINPMVLDAGFKLPDHALIDPEYYGLNAEQIYLLLLQDQQEQEDAGTQGAYGPVGEPMNDLSDMDNPDFKQDDDAGPQPSTGDPGGCGEVLNAAPTHDRAALDEVEQEWEVAVRQAVNVARRATEGKLPGFIREIVDDLNDPRTDWREVLRRFVDPSSTKDYTWSKPNPRLAALGYVAPGTVTDGVNHVALLIDTSGSIDHEWLRKFGGEAQAALDDGAIDRVTLVFADDGVQRTAEYNKGDQLDFTVEGRGGTAFSPTFDWLNKNAPDVSAAIYFTDLCCSDFGPEPTYPVLWAVYGRDPRMIQSVVPQIPFGEVMVLQD